MDSMRQVARPSGLVVHLFRRHGLRHGALSRCVAKMVPEHTETPVASKPRNLDEVGEALRVVSGKQSLSTCQVNATHASGLMICR